jgi:hypothetical protein
MARAGQIAAAPARARSRPPPPSVRQTAAMHPHARRRRASQADPRQPAARERSEDDGAVAPASSGNRPAERTVRTAALTRPIMVIGASSASKSDEPRLCSGAPSRCPGHPVCRAAGVRGHPDQLHTAPHHAIKDRNSLPLAPCAATAANHRRPKRRCACRSCRKDWGVISLIEEPRLAWPSGLISLMGVPSLCCGRSGERTRPIQV